MLIAFAVRHGDTDLNERGVFRSWLNPNLSEKGIAQAEKAAAYLEKFDIKRVFSCPLNRTLQTAHIYADKHEIEVEQHGALFPWMLGVFAGLPKDLHRDALELFVKNPSVAIPNGESLDEFEDRSQEFFEDALSQASGDNLTAFFTHTSNITALVNLATGERGAEPEGGETVGPGGVVAIYEEKDGYRVEPMLGEVKPAKFGGS